MDWTVAQACVAAAGDDGGDDDGGSDAACRAAPKAWDHVYPTRAACCRAHMSYALTACLEACGPPVARRRCVPTAENFGTPCDTCADPNNKIWPCNGGGLCDCTDDGDDDGGGDGDVRGWALSLVGIAVLLCACGGGCVVYRRRRRARPEHEEKVPLVEAFPVSEGDTADLEYDVPSANPKHAPGYGSTHGGGRATGQAVADALGGNAAGWHIARPESPNYVV